MKRLEVLSSLLLAALAGCEAAIPGDIANPTSGKIPTKSENDESESTSLEAPAILALQSPTTGQGKDISPTIRVSGGGVKAGVSVRLYSDATCTTKVGLATASLSFVNITTSDLSDGSYNFYAKVVDGDLSSACSTASVAYQVSTQAPTVPLLALSSPTSSPSNDSTPTFSASLTGGAAFASTHILELRVGATCATASPVTVNEATTGLSATSTLFTPTTALSTNATYNYWIHLTDVFGNTSCSAAALAYAYDSTAAATPVLAMASGSSNPDVDSTPTFTITRLGGGNFTTGDVVTLYEGGDGTCNGTARGTTTLANSTTASVDLTTGSALTSFGAVNFYAKIAASSGTSACSAVLAYTYRPAAAAAVARQLPAATPGNSTTPTIRVSGGGVVNATTVTLYTNSTCTSASVGSGSATGTSIDIVTSALTAGSYLFYATVTSNGTASACSTVAAAYVLDTTAPAAPGLAFGSPASSPATDSTPQFTITLEGGGNFAATDSVTLHTGADCSGAALGTDELATGHSGTSVGLTVAAGSAQSEGTTTYRAKVTDEAGNATCSTAHVTAASQGKTYLYDNTAPTWADSVTLASATSTSTTAAPQITYTANAADGASGSGIADYEYSIGTSSGGIQVRGWTTTGGTPFTPASLTLTIGTTYYINLRAKDNVALTSTVITKSWQVVSVPTLSFAGATGTTGTRGAAMSVTPTTLTTGTGATISSCAVTAGGSLPTGVTLNNTTCVISGTPTTFLASTAFTITVTNSYSQTAAANVTLEVNEDWSDDSNDTIGFAGASKVGTAWSTDKIVLAADTDCDGDLGESETAYTNCNELNASWAPQWSSLTAYWKMNNDWNDAKGTKHGSGVGSPTFSAAARMGSHAGSFNGSQSVDVPNDVISASGDLTISAWIKTSSAGETSILNNNNGGDGRFSFHATSASGGTYRLFIFIGKSTGSFALWGSTPVNDNRWHHAVATRISGTWTIYLDGLEDGSGSTANPIDNTKDLFVANSPWGSAGFNGTLDDLAIWSTGLTASEVQTIYRRQRAQYSGSITSRVFDAAAANAWDGFRWATTLPFGKELTGDADGSGTITSADSEISTDYPSLVGSTGSTGANDLMTGLVGLWHFNESTWADVAGEVQDASGQGYHARAKGGAITARTGVFSQAGSFDGTNDYVDLGSFTALDGATAFTVSTWVKPATLAFGNFTGIFTLGTNAQRNVWLHVQDNTGKVYANFHTTDGVGYSCGTISNGALRVGVWNHVVATWNGSVCKVYFDAVADSAVLTSNGTTLVSSLSNRHIGYLSGFAYFKGLIDEVAVWNRALHANEVLQLYRRGANRVVVQARACADATCSTDPTWMGPALVKSGTTAPYSFFSELANNTSLDASGLPTGRVNISLPNMLFSAFSGLTFPSSRYFQYRAILESDDTGTACSATWCGPDLKSVTVTP